MKETKIAYSWDFGSSDEDILIRYEYDTETLERTILEITPLIPVKELAQDIPLSSTSKQYAEYYKQAEKKWIRKPKAR